MLSWVSRSHLSRAAGLAIGLTALFCSPVAGQTARVTGSVHDTSGAAIAGATVTLRAGQFTGSAKTDSNGEFRFLSVPVAAGSVQVSANGFSPAEQAWTAAGEAHLSFVLKPAGGSERIVVSATRSEMRLSEVPGSAVLLASEDIAANPSLMLDDALRQIPGFTLFRRSSSRVSNPTAQGVSLRGLGASGPSRALVLEDGVPLVDPFGGWVYWDRVPRAELSSVEVFRGGSSNLYGSDALGGVVQFLGRVPEGPAAVLDFSYGNESTPNLSAWTGTSVSRWDLSAAVDMFRTGGYILVPASQRGRVDTAANSEHATVEAAVGYRISDAGRVFLRGSFFDEARHNGTPIQKNSTGTGFAAAGLNLGVGGHDWISARLYGQAQGYDQTFSSIFPDRSGERLTNIQHVPSQQMGGSGQWNHTWKAHTLIGGADLQEVLGASSEQLFSSTSGFHFANNIAGGRQRTIGIFGQDIFRSGPWTLIAGARWDDWRNFDGSNVRIPTSTNVPSVTPYADRTETSFSPRASILRALGSNLSLSISGYRAFRAPTLNELYRTFQQGNTRTLNNPQLRAERLTGAETGIRATGLNNKLELRGTVFWADIVDPITNVTIDPNSNPVLRQRQNLGRTRSIGTELDGRLRWTDAVQISAGYQYTHATVVDSSPQLIGLNVPEVPRHQFTWEVRYWNPSRLMLSLQGRYSGLQFDDDRNTLALDHYFVMDVFAGRRLGGGLEVYFAAENLLDQRYAVALTPTAAAAIMSLGPPFLARAGVRWQLPRVRK